MHILPYNDISLYGVVNMDECIEKKIMPALNDSQLNYNDESILSYALHGADFISNETINALKELCNEEDEQIQI